MKERRRWAISALVGIALLAISSLTEESHETGIAFGRDPQTGDWTYSGTFRFSRLSTRLFGHSFHALQREGSFALRIPDEANKGVSTSDYRPQAIAEARQSATKWQVHPVPLASIVLGYALFVRFFWWLGQQYKRNPPTETVPSPYMNTES